MNVYKTKDMIVDSKRNRNGSNTVSSMKEEVEVVEEYKYQSSPEQQPGEKK